MKIRVVSGLEWQAYFKKKEWEGEKEKEKGGNIRRYQEITWRNKKNRIIYNTLRAIWEREGKNIIKGLH